MGHPGGRIGEDGLVEAVVLVGLGLFVGRLGGATPFRLEVSLQTGETADLSALPPAFFSGGPCLPAFLCVHL